MLLVVGGQAPKAIRSVEYYDFKEERWYQVAELPTRRCRAGKNWSTFFSCILDLQIVLIVIAFAHFIGLCVLAGRVYAVGGFNGSLRVRTVDVYDASSDQWSSSPGMEARRSTLGVAVLNNFIYAVNYRL